MMSSSTLVTSPCNDDNNDNDDDGNEDDASDKDNGNEGEQRFALDRLYHGTRWDMDWESTTNYGEYERKKKHFLALLSRDPIKQENNEREHDDEDDHELKGKELTLFMQTELKRELDVITARLRRIEAMKCKHIANIQRSQQRIALLNTHQRELQENQKSAQQRMATVLDGLAKQESWRRCEEQYRKLVQRSHE